MELYHKIPDLLKIRYKHDSLDPKQGLNCFTFVLHYFNMLDKYDSFEIPECPIDWWTSQKGLDFFYVVLLKLFRSAILYDGKAYPTRLYEHQVLGFSKYDEYRKITHLGIYIGDRKIIHCCEDKGVVISPIVVPLAKIKIVGDIK